MEQKLTHLNAAIKLAAERLGLVFVDGPDTTNGVLPEPSLSVTNGQHRAVYLFAVAEHHGSISRE